MPGLSKIFGARCRSAVSVVLILGLAGCATPFAPASREPANLSSLKAEIVRYVDSGDHERDVATVATQAQAWLEQRVRRKAASERLAVIFDIDETLLFNWETMTGADFGYSPPVWDAWVLEGRAPVIVPVREAYRSARRLGVEVIFITGRKANQHEATARNLRAVDCGDYLALICKPDLPRQRTGEFKLAERKRLTAEGLTIIASVGDQESDFFGGYAERTFKLPGPFYRTE